MKARTNIVADEFNAVLVQVQPAVGAKLKMG
jgi:hypothetical protein